MPSRRRASSRGRGIQLSPSRFVETLIMPFECGASDPFGRADCLDPHPNQGFAVIFIRPNSERDVPWRRWQFICRRVEIDSAAMPIALTQTKNEMLLI